MSLYLNSREFVAYNYTHEEQGDVVTTLIHVEDD